MGDPTKTDASCSSCCPILMVAGRAPAERACAPLRGSMSLTTHSPPQLQAAPEVPNLFCKTFSQCPEGLALCGSGVLSWTPQAQSRLAPCRGEGGPCVKPSVFDHPRLFGDHWQAPDCPLPSLLLPPEDLERKALCWEAAMLVAPCLRRRIPRESVVCPQLLQLRGRSKAPREGGR